MQRVLILGFVWVVACGPQPDVCNMGGTGGFSGAGGGFSGRDSPAPPPQDAGFGGAGGRLGFPMTRVGLVGKPMQIILGQAQRVSCGPGSKVVEVITEVFDPMNRPVEHTRSAELGFSTTITFTPAGPGDYHVSARFEPAIGTAQADVVVVVDMTSAPSTTLNTLVPCRSLEVLPSGLVLCQTSSSLRAYRDGALLQTFDSDEFAVAGNVVWTARIGIVRRLVDNGGAMPLVAEGQFDTMIFDTGLKLIGTQTQLIASGGMRTVRLAFQNAALIKEKQLDHYVAQSTSVFAGPELDTLLFLEGDDGFNRKLCSYDLKGDRDLGCQQVGRVENLGTDATGHWSHGDTTLRVDSIDKNGIVQTATMAFNGIPFTNTAFTDTHFQTTPAIATMSGLYLVPRLTAAGIQLDAYEFPAGFVPKGGSTKVLRAEHSDGRQLLFTRPQ